MLRKTARGFTLIELMIVVAIIGILSAIAIPNFLNYQLKTRRSEGSINVTAIKATEIAFRGDYDSYLQAAAEPGTINGSTRTAWNPIAVDPANLAVSPFRTLGWAPEGTVYFQYGVNTTANYPDAEDFTVYAVADIDGDGTNFSCWVYGRGSEVGEDPPGGAAACTTAWISDPADDLNNVERTFLSSSPAYF